MVFVLLGSAGRTVQKSFRQLLFACYVKRIDDKIIKRYKIKRNNLKFSKNKIIGDGDHEGNESSLDE